MAAPSIAPITTIGCKRINLRNKKLESMFKRKEVTIFECEEEDLHVKLLEKWLLGDLKPGGKLD